MFDGDPAHGHLADMSSAVVQQMDTGNRRKSSLALLTSAPPGAPRPLTTSWSEPNFKYNHALGNDNIVIVESGSTTPRENESTPPATNQQHQPQSVSRRRLEYSKSVVAGVRSDRAGATLRNLSDAELPQPETVRRAKDVFETMARQRDQPSPLPRSISTPDKNTVQHPSGTHPAHIARSKSMLVLTGRAWCNGNGGAKQLTPNLTFQHQHHHGVCSDALRGARHAAFFQPPPTERPPTTTQNTKTYQYYQPGNSRTLPLPSKIKKADKQRPHYKRSCSDLDRFFSPRNGYDLDDDDHSHDEESTEDRQRHDSSHDSVKLDDNWGRHLRQDGGHRNGSPVSPEAIRKIREQGMCVTYFGGQAYVEAGVEETADDASIDGGDSDTDLRGHGYMLDYPHDLYTTSDGTTSSSVPQSPSGTNGRSRSSERPKIIGVVPKYGAPPSSSNRDGSYCSSVASSMSSGSTSNGGSESVSPAPPASYNGALSPTSAWFLGGLNQASLEDLRLSLNPVHQLQDGGDDYFRRPQNKTNFGGVRLIDHAHAPRNYRHGQWMKNPYWQGSYYVIFDFTDKDVRSNVDAC